MSAVTDFAKAFSKSTKSNCKSIETLFTQVIEKLEDGEALNAVLADLTEQYKKPTKNTKSRPKSAYLIFCDEHRPLVKQALLDDGDDAKPASVMRALGAKWKAISEEDKARYQSLAGEAKNMLSEDASCETECKTKCEGKSKAKCETECKTKCAKAKAAAAPKAEKAPKAKEVKAAAPKAEKAAKPVKAEKAPKAKKAKKPVDEEEVADE